MSRNGSGVYSLSDTIAPSDPQSSTVLMAILQDIAAALSGSIASDGQTSITGALKGSDGTASLPAYSFASDPNTGIYRIAADTIGIACGGVEVARVNSSGVTIASGKTLTLPSNGGGSVLKPGDLVIFTGPIANIPAGRLLCDGTAVSRTTYSALFAAIGTTHGAGDGTTTFNLPDLTNQFIVGASADDSGTAKTDVTGSLTQTGGSKDAVVVSHTHEGTTDSDGLHTHAFNYAWRSQIAAGGAQTVADYPAAQSGTTASGGAHTHTFTTDSAGSSGTNANLPPYYALAFTVQT